MAILVRLLRVTLVTVLCIVVFAALFEFLFAIPTAGCRHVLDTQEGSQISDKGFRSAGIQIDTIRDVGGCYVGKGWEAAVISEDELQHSMRSGDLFWGLVTGETMNGQFAPLPWRHSEQFTIGQFLEISVHALGGAHSCRGRHHAHRSCGDSNVPPLTSAIVPCVRGWRF